MLSHLPYTGAGIIFEEGEDKQQVLYQAAHHELVASALAVKACHEIIPNAMMGCMLAAGNVYPYSSNPEDYWEVMKMERDSYFLIDVQSKGEYPGYAKRFFIENGIQLQLESEDLEILKTYTVDYIGFSYYSSRCISADPEILKNFTDGNVFGSVINPYLETSEWGWTIDPKGMRITCNRCMKGTTNHCLSLRMDLVRKILLWTTIPLKTITASRIWIFTLQRLLKQ
jgi:6-phospho-beta-glucosidase